ncbi:MAG: hypothetical protein PF442_11890 [Desulfobulbaceae bacterium]|nr:hypothetical protein [Desulfobulbaceae bacterium]
MNLAMVAGIWRQKSKADLPPLVLVALDLTGRRHHQRGGTLVDKLPEALTTGPGFVEKMTGLCR